MVAKGEEEAVVWTGRFGISRCKLFQLEWICNGVFLYSTRNYIQSILTDDVRRKSEMKNVCVGGGGWVTCGTA